MCTAINCCPHHREAPPRAPQTTPLAPALPASLALPLTLGATAASALVTHSLRTSTLSLPCQVPSRPSKTACHRHARVPKPPPRSIKSSFPTFPRASFVPTHSVLFADHCPARPYAHSPFRRIQDFSMWSHPRRELPSVSTV